MQITWGLIKMQRLILKVWVGPEILIPCKLSGCASGPGSGATLELQGSSELFVFLVFSSLILSLCVCIRTFNKDLWDLKTLLFWKNHCWVRRACVSIWHSSQNFISGLMRWVSALSLFSPYSICQYVSQLSPYSPRIPWNLNPGLSVKAFPQ